MKLFSLLILLAGFTANAAVLPQPQDIKLPTQKMIEDQVFTNPLAASSTVLSAGAAGNTSAAAATLSSFSAQPDMARNITITPVGNTAHQNACVITVNGLNYLGHAISESISLSSTQATIATGSKAFASVTSVVFPAACEASTYDVTYNIGVGSKLGVKRCLDAAGNILFSTLNGAKEATAPTMAANVASVELNTSTFNGTLDGSNDFELFFMQNFRCTR